MHMAYLASSVWLRINSATLDLDRPFGGAAPIAHVPHTSV